MLRTSALVLVHLILYCPAPLHAQDGDAARLIKRLEAGLYAAELKKTVDELKAAAPDAATREAARKALDVNRAKKLEAFRKEFLRRGAQSLPALRAELDGVRTQALALIFNPTAYPEADHGKAAQPKVDEAVAKVRDLWENPVPKLLERDKTLAKQAQDLKVVVFDLIPSLDGPPPPAEAEWTRSLLPEDPGAARKFWTTPLTPKEKEWLAWNDRVAATNAKTAGVPDACREQVRILNDYRVMMGVHSLEIDARLGKAAEKHSVAMQKEGKIWHDGSDGAPDRRIRSEGYPQAATGENVSSGPKSPAEAHQAWFESSGHHRNMLSSLWSQIGVGEAENYWTQNFGNAKPAAGNAPPRLPFAADKTGR